MLFSLPSKGSDSRQSWLTALLLTLTLCLSSSGFRSAGFLYVGIMDWMKVSRGEASWPLSLIGAVTNLSGCFSGPLCQIYSPRPLLLIGTLIAAIGMMLSSLAQNVFQLSVTMGVIYGFGNGLVLTTTNIFLTQHFVKCRAMAFGMVYGGSTMASFIFPSFLLWLNGFFSINWVLLILGGILLNMFVFALLIHEPEYVVKMKQQATEDNQRKGRISLPLICSIMCSVPFNVLLISNVTIQWAFDAFMTTLVDFGLDKGLTLPEAVGLLPLFSIADVVGRVVLPIACDKGLIERRQMLTIAYTLTGVGLAALACSNSYATLVCAIMFAGMFLGNSLVLFACIVGDFMGLERLPMSFAILGFVNGLFFFLKPSFLGYFRDYIKSYEKMCLFCACLATLTGIMWIGFVVYMKKKESQEEEKQQQQQQQEFHDELNTDAFRAAAAVAPTATSEALRRGSIQSAVFSASEPNEALKGITATFDNLAFVPEERRKYEL